MKVDVLTDRNNLVWLIGLTVRISFDNWIAWLTILWMKKGATY